MTDPNKAAVTESNAQFLARMNNPADNDRPGDFERLIALAEELVMIEEHKIDIQHSDGMVAARNYKMNVWEDREDMSTAIRSVVAKIGEGK